MNTCGRCIHKPFCQSPGPVCSSFKDQDRFADRDEVIREFAEAVKMAFYYEFDEMIPSIMSDKIDELVKERTTGG